jgi:hypothetical protein
VIRGYGGCNNFARCSFHTPTFKQQAETSGTEESRGGIHSAHPLARIRVPTQTSLVIVTVSRARECDRGGWRDQRHVHGHHIERDDRFDHRDDLGGLQRRHGSAALAVAPPASTATLTATDRSGERVTSNPAGIKCHGGNYRVGVVPDRDVDHAQRVERPRRDLVGRLFEWRQQDEDVHVHANAAASVTANVQ